MLMKTVALIGDIVSSRQVARRGEFQTRLAALLKQISSRNPVLVSPYTITLGDEFQAVYKAADTLFLDIFTIMTELFPVEVRFGVGLGELTTSINKKQALGMDGPAFHRAREAISGLKKTDYRLGFKGAPAVRVAEDRWKLLQHLLNLISHTISGWSRNRLFIMRGLLAGKSVADFEKELKISRVAVYKNINAAALNDLVGLCEEITRILNQELKTS